MTTDGQARSSAHSHAGHKRKQNQDSIHMDDNHGLWVVAGGMGGHHGGEIASAIACEVIPEQISQHVDIESALRAAHSQIVSRGKAQAELKGMGTTVVAVLEQGQHFEMAWSGDSRIYRWRSGKLTQRSEDHSIVQRMLKSGLISEQQAKVHPHQHVISSCLGSTSADGLEIGYQRDAWEQGDWLLLCSDGLTDELDDARMASILARHSDIHSASAELLKSALDAGGKDNVSLAIIRAPDDAPKGQASSQPLHPVVLGVLGSVLALGILLAIKFL